MSTSAMRKHAKTHRIRIWLLISLGCVAVSAIYARFSHGVSARAMTFLFLYPLLGGALPYAAMLPVWSTIMRGRLCRPASLCLHAGIATLTVGSFLKGILEIAGSSSAYLPAFFIVGWGFWGGGLALFVAACWQGRA